MEKKDRPKPVPLNVPYTCPKCRKKDMAICTPKEGEQHLRCRFCTKKITIMVTGMMVDEHLEQVKQDPDYQYKLYGDDYGK